MTKTYKIKAGFVETSLVTKIVRIEASSEEEAREFLKRCWYTEERTLSRQRVDEFQQDTEVPTTILSVTEFKLGEKL
jgi:hypothetical protein